MSPHDARPLSDPNVRFTKVHRSPFSRALGRIADHGAGRKVRLRFTADYRIACFSLPLIKRLLANTADGETYRCSIAEWPVNERPPLYVHRGVVSTLRGIGRAHV